ncbi:MAG: flagellar motor switch protein FliN [Planctomycetes bacterium]|nr:flagellar motor switch protein FliN [Planctomycetota bacterium]
MSDEPAQNIEKAIDEATAAVAVQTGKLSKIEGDKPAGEAMGMDGLLGVPVKVSVEVGRAKMTLAELVRLSPGSVVELDRDAHQPVDILVGGKLVARGEVVTIGDKYGVRVTSVQGS